MADAARPSPAKFGLPVVLSLNAGYVDTAGFLALQGLFTAHVTGNFVTLGAALVYGTSGILLKLLALPTFCAVVVVTRLASYGLPARGVPVLRTMLILKVALLVVGSALIIGLGPFPKADSLAAIAAGLSLVAAMAIQNAAHRIHLGTAPPTTLMTGTTTQIMIDVADVLRGVKPEQRATVIGRLKRMGANVGAFALGCGAAALLFVAVGGWCFVVPPIVGLATVLMRLEAFRGDVG